MKNQKFILFCGMLIPTILTIVLSVFTVNIDSRFDFLFFLPLSFLIACTFNNKIFKYILNNVVVSIIVSLYFIRNVVAIGALYIDNYSSIFNNFTSNDMNISVLIMSLDVIIIFSFLNYEINSNCDKYYKRRSITYKNKNSIIFDLVIFGIITLLVFSWVSIPEIKLNYTSIFDLNFAEFSTSEINSNVARGGINRLLLSLSLLLIRIFRVIIPVYLLKWIKLNIKYSLIRLVLFYAILFLQLLLIPGNTMDPVISMIVIFIVFLKINGNNKKAIISSGILSGIILILILVQHKMASISGSSLGISLFLQAYFPGVCNLAGIFNMNSDINKFYSLFSDLYTMIPFRNSIFGIKVGLKTVEIYNQSNSVRGQIIPFIGEAYYYLEYLAFIIPILIIKISLHYYKKAKEALNIFEYAAYIYITVYFAISPVLYHNTILGSFFFGVAVPMLTIIRFNKFRIKRLK